MIIEFNDFMNIISKGLCNEMGFVNILYLFVFEFEGNIYGYCLV